VGNGSYPWAIVDGGGRNDVIDHNTFANGWTVEVGQSNAKANASNERVTNNIMTGGLTILAPQSAGGIAQDYNLGVSGTHSVSGTPAYVGGSRPSTYAGYRLASGSAGAGKASDGSNLGIK
jgi:hypothetical protein